MKKILLLTGQVIFSLALNAQVGIGTLTPNANSLLELSSNTKGLLLPRMSAAERDDMLLTSADAGMMIYVTDSPKGIHTYNGNAWLYHAPVDQGSNTSTLRWDNMNSKWITSSSLANGGGSIGINMGGLQPNYQLHIHTGGLANTRLQMTSGFTTASQSRGFIIGIGGTTQPGIVHLLQQEKKALWIGTDGIERMRIDSVGRVGINTAAPSAKFEVNGTFKLGTGSSELQNIYRFDALVDLPMMGPGQEWTETIVFPNAQPNAVVYVSPAAELNHIMIAYAWVSALNTIKVKFVNMSTEPENDVPQVMMHVAVIQ